jgi:hypothetical protein
VTLAETAWGALNKALEVYQDNPRATHWLHRHLARFSEPLRLAIVGAEGTGKSTLLNAIVGEQVELGARAIAEYRASTTVSATVYRRPGHRGQRAGGPFAGRRDRRRPRRRAHLGPPDRPAAPS